MPLPTQNVELVIAGLAQGLDPKVQPQGTLVLADNVEFDKAGAANKRRGKRLVPLGEDINSDAVAEVFSAVATHEDELLLFSDDVYAVADPRARVDGTSVIRRGPALRGAYLLHTIVGVGISERTAS